MKKNKYKKNSTWNFYYISFVSTLYFLKLQRLVYVYSYSEKIEKQSENMQIVLGGEAVGIKLLATGVLVMQVDREDVDIKVGDIILSVNGEQVDTNAKLQEIAKKIKWRDFKFKNKKTGAGKKK